MAEHTLDFARKIFRNPFGFSLDFGPCGIHIAYTSEVDDKTRVHFVKMPREKHEEAFSMLAEKCSGKLEPGSEVFICGDGGSELENLSEQLRLKFRSTSIFDPTPLVTGFLFLHQHLPWTDLIIKPSPYAFDKGVRLLSSLRHVVKSMSTGKMKRLDYTEVDKYESAGGTVHPAPKEHIVFPVMLSVIGYSACCIIKVYEDGVFEVCDRTSISGRTFVGLGSLLTGSKGPDELAELVNKGNSSRVDVHTQHLMVNMNDNFYSQLADVPDSPKIFSFGQAVQKRQGDFREEDLCQALVCGLVNDWVNLTYNCAIQHGVNQVVFLGSLPGLGPFIQDEFTKLFARRRFALTLDHKCDCYYLKHAAQCELLGNLLRNLSVVTEVSGPETS